MATMPWTPWMDATLPMGPIESGAAEVPKQHGAQVELLAEATEEEDHLTNCLGVPSFFFQRRKVRWEDDDNC